MTVLWAPSSATDEQVAAWLAMWPAEEVRRSPWVTVARWEVVG